MADPLRFNHGQSDHPDSRKRPLNLRLSIFWSIGKPALGRSKRFAAIPTGSGPSPFRLTFDPRQRRSRSADPFMGRRNRTSASLTYEDIRRISDASLFTPDGQTLITASEDRTIRMWNPKTGEPTKLLFTRYDHNVCSLSLSPDGLMLARGSHNKDIKIWEVTTGTELMTLLGKDQYDHHWSVCVAFSPDGIHLASGNDIGKMKLWEVLPRRRGKISASTDTGASKSEDDQTETRGFFVEDDGGFQKADGNVDRRHDLYARWQTADHREAAMPTIKFFEMPTMTEIRTLKGHAELGARARRLAGRQGARQCRR